MKRFQRDTVPLMEYLREQDARKQIKVLALEFLERWWAYMKLRSALCAAAKLVSRGKKSNQGRSEI